MNYMLQTIFSWQLIMFGLTIAGVMYVVQSFVDYFEASANVKFYKTVMIPSMYIILGGMLGYFLNSFPYPDQLITNLDRVIFGIVAGLLAEPLYKLIRFVL